MRILFVALAVFLLAGCETLDSTSISVSTLHVVPVHHRHGHIRYTLGYYDSHYFNGYRVYGTYGHRYYYAPRYYRHHRHFDSPHRHHKRHDRRDHRWDRSRERRHERREHRNDRRHDRRHDRHDERRDRRDRRHHQK